jgi:hypothetical protein
MHTEYVDPNGLESTLLMMQPVRANYWLITKIRTEAADRHQGAASRALKLACADADRENVTLRLIAIPQDSEISALDRDQLWDWYFRHGFRSTGKYRTMHRAPR